MAKAYFIGGAPRAGKSTAIKRFLGQRQIIAAPTDSIRKALRTVASEQDLPSLFKSGRGAFDSEQNVQAMRHNPELVVDHQNAESEIVWKAALGFVEDNLADERDVAIEGVAVLPHNLASLDFDYSAVIIINLEDQTEVILKHAHDNLSDWLHKYSDDVIRAFCNFNRELSNYYFTEAQKYHIPVVTIDSSRFEDSISHAVELLLNGSTPPT